MTANESTTMREEMAAERERLAAEAFERIRTGQLARLDAGRRVRGRARPRDARGRHQRADRPPLQRGLRALDKNPWARKIDKATRNHLLWVADHLLVDLRDAFERLAGGSPRPEGCDRGGRGRRQVADLIPHREAWPASSPMDEAKREAMRSGLWEPRW
jgi:hypothetical protein